MSDVAPGGLPVLKPPHPSGHRRSGRRPAAVRPASCGRLSVGLSVR
ncbi:hypothetical protein [Nonomuraea sp. SYSU D8015]|nr:hypothetical protein [Nonomuraea sp. SYSU D8015]